MNSFSSNLIFIPGAKYDTVKEYDNGSIRVEPLLKRFYMHASIMGNHLLVFNSITGYLLKYDDSLGSSVLLNAANAKSFINCKGFCYHQNQFVFISQQGNSLLVLDADFSTKLEIDLGFNASSITSGSDALWISDSIQSTIIKGDLQDNSFCVQQRLDVFHAGNASLCFNDGFLWLADSEENIIRVVDPASNLPLYAILTPYPDPQSLVFFNGRCWVLYGGEMSQTSYENRCWQEQKPFLHELKYQVHYGDGYNYTLSNPILVEFTIEEKFGDEIPASKNSIKVLLSTPQNTLRQQVLEIKPIGLPMMGQNADSPGMMEFMLPSLDRNASGFIGYRALLRLAGCRYTLNASLRQELSLDERKELSPYLCHQEELDSDRSEMIQLAAQIPNGSFSDMVISARDLVFSKLRYRPNGDARDFIELLDEGYGTCGDYTSIMMALLINKGIPVRSIGGYKVPRFTNAQGENISNYYNHSWLEFFQPGIGWLPVESSSDQRGLNGRFSRAQFMGEDWSHIRTHVGKNVPDHIHVKQGSVHPHDIFDNITFMKVLGETDF